MITVWGRETSSNVQLVMWAIAELGLECERIDAGGAFGGLDAPDYLAMNPNAKIPTLCDGDLVLWESCAILRYLGARYGDEAFWPGDPARRARLDIWAEWAKLNFAAAFTNGIFWPLVRTPASARDMAAVARSEAQLKELAAIIGPRLGDGPYLGGEALSFADIALGHVLYRYFEVDFDRAETLDLADYYARLQARPAYARHVMVSFDSLRVE